MSEKEALVSIRESGAAYNGNSISVGLVAHDMLLTLADAPRRHTRPYRWLAGDYMCLSAMVSLESHLPYFYVDHSLSHIERCRITRSVMRSVGEYRDALPFASADRRLVVKAFNADRGPGPWPHRVARLADMTATTLSAGLRTDISGQELMRRWWSWRHEADEFEGQDSLVVCRRALGSLAAALGARTA